MTKTTELPTAIQSINDWLRTDPAFGFSEPSGVEPLPRVDPAGGDFKAGIIRGASVISKGVTKDARGEVDDTTMRQIIDLGNASPGGSKVRFTHPGLSDDGLGSYLGRAKNFRFDGGGRPRADIHLSAVSEASPKGDLRGYVLKLADQDPDAFGVSVAMKWKEEYQVDANGKPLLDKAGAQLPPLIRAERLHAVDVVDNPAANDGLFADAGLADAPARHATAMLDQLFAGLAPEEVRARVGNFLTRYLRHKGAVSEFSEGDDPMAEVNNPTTPQATPAASAGPASAAAATTPAAPASTTASQTPGANASGSPGPTAEQFREQVRAEEQAAALKRVKEINALCDKAGFSSLALGFLEKGNTIEEVRETLFAKMCADRTPVPGDGKTGELAPKPADPDEKFREEYRAMDKNHRFGVTEEQFVRSRKIDAGLLDLTVGSDVKK